MITYRLPAGSIITRYNLAASEAYVLEKEFVTTKKPSRDAVRAAYAWRGDEEWPWWSCDMMTAQVSDE